MKRKMLPILLSFALAVQLPATVFADGPGNPPGGSSSSSSTITWTGATEITSATTETDQSYSSTTTNQNAVLIETGENVIVNLNNPTVSKTGSTTNNSDNYSFYGINSAVMAKGGGTTNITGGTITTNDAGANGVFSYGANSGTTNATGDGTTVNISDTTITTSADGSGGIMTTYGGTTNATNLTITTSGGSSAPIRTDRGGGWVTVNGGTYTSNGQGSPAIYSTADINVSNATLVSNKSEGVCIEGTGSINLTNCALTATNSALNGNACFYDTIMIYQSQSGDASSGTSAFTMTGGSLTSNQGDTFHVTNTNAVITLSGVTITNSSDGVLLSVCDDGWSGASNIATLNANSQTLEGDILVGSDSTLTMTLSSGSTYTGKTSGSITDDKGTSRSTSIGTVNMTIDSGCTWKLTGDSYVTSLTNNGTIDYNGYTLTVGSTSYSDSSSGTGTADSSKATTYDLSAATVSAITNQAYTGKAIKPVPSITLNGTTLTNGTDFSLSYTNNKKIGTATVTITGIGNYTGTITKTFKIVPKKTTLKSVKNTATNTITVKWKKIASGKGYQIQYATNKTFTKNKKTVTVSGKTNITKTISNLKKGKTYYIRVRVKNGKYYSSWSTIKKVKIKK